MTATAAVVTLGLSPSAGGRSGTTRGRAARAPEALETLTVDPNSAVWTTGRVALTAGRPYTLVVGGTAAYKSNPNERFDALFCFEGCGGSGPTRQGFLRLKTPGYTSDFSPIDAFQQPTPDPNCQPLVCPGGQLLDPQHDYTLDFYPPTSGALEAGSFNQFAQQFPGSIYTPGSQLTVHIYNGLINPATGCSRVRLGGAPVARDAAINEVHVVDVKPDMQFHKGGTPADAWLPLEKDTVLRAGDEISSDPDGEATLAFADNSTVNVSDTTQLKIGSFFTEGGVVRTEILLKMGQVAACVNKSEATKSDFRIKSPTGVASVRGTIFTMFYDPGSRTSLVSTSRGRVRVTPSNSRLRPVSVGAGREVEVTRTSESRVVRFGRAGARGGVDVLHARALVLAAVARNNRACKASTPRTGAFAVLPGRGGWVVKVRLIGGLTGTSVWSVTGGRVAPVNGLAKSLQRGCR